MPISSSAITILLLVFISCNTKTDREKTNFKYLVSDTSIIHRLSNEVEFSKKMSSMLNLPDIVNGVDSFELRVWVNSMAIPHHLVILKFIDSNWFVYDYWYSTNNNFIDSVKIFGKEATQGYDKVVSYLYQKDVLSLPSQQAIENFEDNISDGQIITLEISTKRFYKILQYHCPESYSKEPNNLKFMSIVKTLNPYLKFYVPWCSTKIS